MDQPDNIAPLADDAPQSNRDHPANRVEWFLGVVVAFLLAVVAVPGIKPIERTVLDDPTVRGLEGLLLLARDEAVQTGDDHIVYFGAANAEPPKIEGERRNVMAWVIRDRDGDGRASESEYVASVPVDLEGNVAWGSASATRPAIGDVAATLEGPLSFGSNRASGLDAGLVFRSEGAPVLAAARDDSNSGAGTVYLQSSSRDYAVVLSPWGDVDVQVWDATTSSWRIASAH